MLATKIKDAAGNSDFLDKGEHTFDIHSFPDYTSIFDCPKAGKADTLIECRLLTRIDGVVEPVYDTAINFKISSLDTTAKVTDIVSTGTWDKRGVICELRFYHTQTKFSLRPVKQS